MASTTSNDAVVAEVDSQISQYFSAYIRKSFKEVTDENSLSWETALNSISSYEEFICHLKMHLMLDNKEYVRKLIQLVQSQNLYGLAKQYHEEKNQKDFNQTYAVLVELCDTYNCWSGWGTKKPDATAIVEAVEFSRRQTRSASRKRKND